MRDDAANEEHLEDLLATLGARGSGNITGFFKVPVEWRCPICTRSKAEAARLDKNGNLLCAVPEHHDHFSDEIHSRVNGCYGDNWRLKSAVVESFERFKPILVCNDCNIADVAAKRVVSAPSYFSFAPYEISTFIIVKNNESHQLDRELVKEVYASSRTAMLILARRFSRLQKSLKEGK